MEKSAKANPIGSNVARNVRRLRKRRGLSLAELSHLLAEVGRPLSLKVLSKIENGDRSVDVDDLAALSIALATPTSQLLAPPGVAAQEEVVALLDAWMGLVVERQEAIDMNAKAIAHLEARVRAAVANDEDARAAVEEHLRSTSPPENVYQTMAGIFLSERDAHDGKR